MSVFETLSGNQLGFSGGNTVGEFQFPNTQMLQDPYWYDRRPRISSHELHLTRGYIMSITHKTTCWHDDRLQIVPMELDGFPASDSNNIPWYPMFFPGTMITGWGAGNSSPEAANTLIPNDAGGNFGQVWLLVSDDLQIGYVLGRANSQNPEPYNFEGIRDYLYARQALPEDFVYDHYDLLHNYHSSKGGMIEMVNHRTGDWILLNSSGTIITVQQKKIYIRCGTPPDPPENGPVGFSAITMTGDKITIHAPNVEIEANDLVLGHHNQYLMSCVSKGPFYMGSGHTAEGLPNIHT
jgi:hypothetical protein